MTMPVDPLSEFAVTESMISLKHVERLESLLDSTDTERDIPAFIAANPVVLAQWEGEGRERWVVPRDRLGSAAVDFVLGDRPGTTLQWIAAVFADPGADLGNGGALDALFAQATRPVLDWRAWIAANPEAARQIGLIDADARMRGLVFLGRRRQWSAGAEERRARVLREHNIAVRTYDALTETAKRHCEYWDSWYLGMD
jgi:TusA-related sulfurtransferase